jgi:uncharacterized protein
MIDRSLSQKLRAMAESLPVVSLTGPRQSGKSTLVKEVFPDYRYVSLEDPDVRALAQEDPRSFLSHYDTPTIMDEAQRVPELFSYMQGVVDRRDAPGQYVLSGSQNFLLMRSISQSLAGRTAVLHLLPLSYAELCGAGLAPAGIDDYLFMGGYPRIYAHSVDPTDFLPGYVATYVDRDVRLELGVRKIAEFNTFLTLCATRIGEVLSLKALARGCGISVDTARSWLSLLQQSFVVLLLHPYYRNYGRRLVKSPKLYFYDTGLAASLLGIESAEQLFGDGRRGPLYENAVVSEVIKGYYAQGREPKLFYWRDSSKNEIDLIIEKGGRPRRAIEVKSSATYKASAFGAIDRLADDMGLGLEERFVVYGGSEPIETSHGTVVGLADLGRLVC